MTALEYARLILFGGGAVIGLFILLKIAHFIFRQVIRLIRCLLRLIYRGVPHLIVEVLAAFLASFITAIIAAVIGVPVDELLARFGSWFATQGSAYVTFLSDLTAQIGTTLVS
ncbi:MAG: hypothetical protein H6656_04640 [Ardenticatenaceae bacterium]|nr:hypothetical protein [Ardenticatenaceae bacterium]